MMIMVSEHLVGNGADIIIKSKNFIFFFGIIKLFIAKDFIRCCQIVKNKKVKKIFNSLLKLLLSNINMIETNFCKIFYG